MSPGMRTAPSVTEQAQRIGEDWWRATAWEHLPYPTGVCCLIRAHCMCTAARIASPAASYTAGSKQGERLHIGRRECKPGGRAQTFL